MNLQLTGRWKDLRETTSWQAMCTCPLVASPWRLNVLWPPPDHGRCTPSVSSHQSNTYVKQVKDLERCQSAKRDGVLA